MSNANTSLDIAGNLTIDAFTNGAPDAATGDEVIVSAVNTGATSGLAIAGDLRIDTSATNGSELALAEAGGISILADNGLISFTNLTAEAWAGPNIGGKAFFFTGADHHGGDITITSTNGGVIDGQSVLAESFGLGNNTGSGTAGAVSIIANDGSISIVNAITVDSSGTGGSAGGFVFGPQEPTDGIGGDFTIDITGAAGALSVGSLSVDTSGVGANGGDGIAGAVTVGINAGTLNAQDFTVTSDGFGGSSGGGGGIILLSPLAAATPMLALATTPAAAGGDGDGGTVVFNLDGGNTTVANLTVSAQGVGGNGAGGSSATMTSGGAGGAGTGGTATFNGTAGTLDVTGLLAVNADGFAGGGGDGAGTMGGAGGAGTGGNATFNLNGTATITAGSVEITADGVGGQGGASFENGGVPDAGGGAGGIGQGGTAIYNDIAGTIDFTQMTVRAVGVGGEGGDSSGPTIGTAQGAGGVGGAGIGGIATINLQRDDATLKSYIVDAGGGGAQGGSGDTPGTGGAGQGGTASLLIDNVAVAIDSAAVIASASGGNGGVSDGASGTAANGADATGGNAIFDISGASAGFVSTPSVGLDVSAMGGTGGSGRAGDAVVAGSDGGTGGNGQGGSAQFIASGGAVASFNDGTDSISGNGIGGAGGQGGGNFLGGSAGTGGTGGNGTGGTVLIEANTLAQITIVPTSVSIGISSNGIGGQGGGGGNIDMINGGIAGTGGDGGTGTGGSPILRGFGGTILGSGIDLNATGSGGVGGIGGDDGTVVIGAQGNGGDGIGGTPSIEAIEGSPGIITLGSVSINASGIAGFGTITGITTGGSITLTDASTDPAGLITMSDLFATATGMVAPAQAGFTMTAGSGPITVTNAVTVNTVGDIVLDFDADGQLVAGGAISLTAGGEVLVQHTNNTGLINTVDTPNLFNAVSQGGNITLTDAIISADTITLNAALSLLGNGILRSIDDIGITVGQDIFAEEIDAGGELTSAGLVGGAIEFEFATPGNFTVGTLIEGSGTQLRIVAGGNLQIDDLTVNPVENIVLIGGNGGVGDVTLGVVSGAQDITLTGNNVTYTDLVATRDIDILANAGNVTGGSLNAGRLLDVIGESVAIGDVTSGNILDIDATVGDLTAGVIDSTGSPVRLDAPGNITTGDISGGGLGVAVNAGGNIDVGVVTSAGGLAPDIGLTAGGDVTFVSLDAGRLVNIDGSLITGGNIISVSTTDVNGDIIDIGDVTTTNGFVQLDTLVGDITAGNLTAGNFAVQVNSAGNITIGDSIAGGGVTVTSVGDTIMGSGTAGTILTLNIGGNLTSGDLVDNAASPGMNITVGGDANIASATSNNSLLDIDVIGALTGGNFSGASLVTIDAASLDVGDLTSTGQSLTVTTTGGDISFANASAPGALDFGASGAITGNSVVGNPVDLLADGAITLATATGTINSIVSTNGAVTITSDLDAAQTVSGTSVSVTDTNEIVINNLDATSGDVDLTSVDDVSVGILQAAGDVRLTSTNGGVGTSFVTAGLAPSVGGAGPGDIIINSADDAFGNFTAARDIIVNADVFIETFDMDAGRNIVLDSGDIVMIEGVATAVNDILINAVGDVVVEDPLLAGNNITITSGDDVILDQGPSLIDASNTVTISAADEFRLEQGSVLGTIIDITTRDPTIVQGNGVAIGDAGRTQLITFTNTTDPIFIGDDSPNTGFDISDGDLTAIHSGGDIVINAVDLPGTEPDITIGDLPLLVGTGSGAADDGNIGPSGSFIVSSAGDILISGQLGLTGANANNSIVLDAQTLLRIDITGGSIELLDPNNGLAGTIDISATDFIAATDAAVADIQGQALDAVEERLSQSDGIDNPAGVIRADTLTIDTTASQVFIQNTAIGTAFDDRRGFEVNTLNISDSGGTIQPIVINGTVGGATGLAAISPTNVTSSFDQRSTINGCIIANPAVCVPPSQIPTDPIDDPTRDLVGEDLTPGDGDPGDNEPGGEGSFGSMLIELKPLDEFGEDPLIDQPVTGAGNEDLWVDPDLCPPGSDDENCEFEPAE